jgi:serine/threonine protein kinase
MDPEDLDTTKDEGAGLAITTAPSLPTPPHRIRTLTPRPGTVGLLRTDHPAASVTSYDAPPPSGTTGPQLATPLLFVCDECWWTFADGSQLVCACERPRPAEGWAAMPYLFRGRYLFVELLGRGGMGAVFRAYDQASKDRPWVAVKVIRKGTTELESTLTEMFRREVAAAQMLAQHKQFFVDVLGFDDVKPAYLALEYVPWQTLEELVASLPVIERRLPSVQVARIGVAILRGLAKMHFHRIVHRDLKPANIFVRYVPEREGYDVKITDLGLWAFDQVQSESDSLSLVGRPGTAGTPLYMSPEQSTGEAVSAASDVHSVGSVLWQLATGDVPYPAPNNGALHEIIETRAKTLRQPPERPGYMPEQLFRGLSKALVFEREQRWNSAGEMRKALEAFVEKYQMERMRDLDGALERIDDLLARVTSLRVKMTPMREVLERLALLGAVLREAREQRGEAEPNVLRTIAENTEVQLEEITRELGALAEWLRVLGHKKGTSLLPPPPRESRPRQPSNDDGEAERAERQPRQSMRRSARQSDIRVHILWAIALVLVAIVIALYVLRPSG